MYQGGVSNHSVLENTNVIVVALVLAVANPCCVRSACFSHLLHYGVGVAQAHMPDHANDSS